LPESSHAKCDSFVKTYGPIIPQLIAELDDPNVVCVLIGLCKKSDDKFIEIPSPNLQKNQTLPCTLCQYLVNYLDAIIQSNSTETKFEQELEKACKILPSTKSQAECKSLVDLFGTDIIKLLVELGNPKLVCQELGICDK
jgi:saposin